MAAFVWRCPVCALALDADASGAVCAEGHRFDRAKQGYLNLLPANHRASTDPGDSREMVRARRDFLNAGHYSPLANRLSSLVTAHALNDSVRMLDLGCGEGYYTAHVANALSDFPDRQIAGLDISRDAVRLAARRYPEISFCVASSFRMPVADASVSVALQVFAPVSADELVRVMRPGGVVAVVQPGPRHLFELRDMVYAQARPHAAPAPVFGESLTRFHTERVGFDLSLYTRSEVAALFAMTPYLWQASRSRRAVIDGLTALDTQAHFELSLYRQGA